jgi:hypothetical protein
MRSSRHKIDRSIGRHADEVIENATVLLQLLTAERTYRDDLLLVRFRATADIHARVASTASVVNDPEPT